MNHLNQFNKLTWHKLAVLFHCKKSSNAMKSHPVSVFQAINKAVCSKTIPFASLHNNIMPIFHIKDKKHTLKINPHDQLLVEFLFFRQPIENVKAWKEELIRYMSNPVYTPTVEILNIGEIEERNYTSVTKEFNHLESFPTEGELCLDLLIPLPFNQEKGKTRVFISKERFIKFYQKRFNELFGTKFDEFTYQPQDDDFKVLPYYLRYTEIKHTSRSQPGTIQFINGTVGKLYLKGKWTNFLPYLILGSEIHIGSKLSNSQGYYKILPPTAPIPYFGPSLPDTETLLNIIREVQKNHDYASEWLSQQELYTSDENAFALKLSDEIKSGSYTPSPSTAFLIPQDNKQDIETDPVTERMNVKDLIISRYLAKVIYKIFDNIYDEKSIGNRKGISPVKAQELIKSAAEEGYIYRIKLSIEDFFPTIELEQLYKLLDFYIPSGDMLLKTLLKRLAGNAYIMDGKYHERVKGLASGNPLSSCLTNLYLHSIDESIKALDIRIIRSADDFIIFCKSPNHAASVLSQAQSFFPSHQ